MLRSAISVFALITVLTACVTAQTVTKPQPTDDLPAIEVVMEAEETIEGKSGGGLVVVDEKFSLPRSVIYNGDGR